MLVIIILFQPELRRALANMGQAPLLRFFDPIKEERLLQECVRGTQALAAERIGALIALERETDLQAYVDGGVGFDARVSRELLFSIFLPASPVHDGAVLIQGNRLSQAGCFLPLSQNQNLAKDLGTRHRAALGLSEETDAAVIIVSEETGAISLALGGELRLNIDAVQLQRELEGIFHVRTQGGGMSPSLRLLARRLPLMAASLALAVGFWFFAVVREEAEVGLLVPLVYEGFPSRLVIDGRAARIGLHPPARPAPGGRKHRPAAGAGARRPRGGAGRQQRSAAGGADGRRARAACRWSAISPPAVNLKFIARARVEGGGVSADEQRIHVRHDGVRGGPTSSR